MFKKEKFLVSTIKFISYLLILLPVALGFLFVYLCGVNVVFWDQWGIAALFDKWFPGEISMSDLLLQSFGGQNPRLHNIFFPRIVMLLLGTITKYNNLVEMYLIQTCFLVTLGCLVLVFKDSIRPRLALFGPILFLPIPFLVFSLRQHQNMLWGFQLTFAFAQTFSVLAFYFLHVSGRTRFVKASFLAAVVSGTVATFSALPGIFVWPAGLLQLILAPIQKSTKRLLIGIWSLIGAVEWIVYLLNYRSPHGLNLVHPIYEARFFLTLLGHSLFGQQSLVFVSSVLLVGLVAVVPLLVYRGRQLGEYSFWIALLLFSLLVLASITVGRNGGAALSSRYVSFSILTVIAVYVILVKAVLVRNSYIVAGSLAILSALIVLSVPSSYLEGIEVGRGTGEAGESAVPFERTTAYRERAAFILATYESQPDEFLEALNPNPENVRDTAPVLERLGYNVFSEPRPEVLPPPLSTLSPSLSSALSEVESISGIKVDQESQPISVPTTESFVEVTGWAVDDEAEDVAGGVYVDIDGKLYPAFYGTDKEGSDTKALADYFGIPSYRYAVFERAVPVSEIGTGTHKLSIVVLSNDRERYYRPAQEVAFELT